MPEVKEVVLGIVTRDFVESISFKQFEQEIVECQRQKVASRTLGKRGGDPDLGGKRVLGRNMEEELFYASLLVSTYSFILGFLSQTSGSTGKMGSFIFCGLCNVYE